MTARTDQEGGFSLMETLVALAIFSLVAVAVVRASPQAASNVYRANQANADVTALAAVLDLALAAGPCRVAAGEGMPVDAFVSWSPVRPIDGGASLYRVEVRKAAGGAATLVTHHITAEQC